MPVHDKTRRDQIGAELWLLKRCRADAAARFEEEEAKAKRRAEDGGQAANANRGGDRAGVLVFFSSSCMYTGRPVLGIVNLVSRFNFFFSDPDVI